MKKPIQRILFLFAVGGAAYLTSVGCSPTGSSSVAGQNEVLRALDNDADIAVYADIHAMNQSAILQKLEDMQEENDSAQDTMEAAEEIKKITGIENENLTHFAFSASNIAAMQANPTELRVSGALYANKPVTAEQIAEAIEYLSLENQGEEIDLVVVPGDQADYIELPPVENGPEMVLAVATGSGSTTLFFGDRASVDGSLNRSANEMAERLMEPSNNLVTGQQGWISVIIPEAFKSQLNAYAAQGAQMVGPGVQAIENLESVGVAARAAEQLDLAVGFNLSSPEEASQIKSVLENSLISTARMMLSGQTEKPLPLLQSLAATENGNRAKLSLSLTMEDFEILQSTLMQSFGPPQSGGPVIMEEEEITIEE